eukprot:4666236-Prorocentrum_lima.AAC.1
MAAATSSRPSTWGPTTFRESTTHPPKDAAKSLCGSAFQISVLSRLSSMPTVCRRSAMYAYMVSA